MDKTEKDFRSAGRITDVRKAAHVLWGCAKAMTKLRRTALYWSLRNEHEAITKQRLQTPNMPRLMKEKMESQLTGFDRTLEAKALLKFGIDKDQRTSS
jgi:hypothetical protein